MLADPRQRHPRLVTSPVRRTVPSFTLDRTPTAASTVDRMANIVEKIAQQVTSVGAKASYGEPVTVGGIELVPVAVVWFGFGGGSDDAEQGGGGGGGVSIPVGAYVRGPDGARFKPNLVAVLAVSVPIAWALSWGVVGVAIAKAGKKPRR